MASRDYFGFDNTGQAYNACIYECIFKIRIAVQKLLLQKGGIGDGVEESHVDYMVWREMLEVEALKR